MSRKRETEKAKKEKLPAGEGRFCYEGLDRVMHEKARLGLLASLAAHANGLLFSDLKQLCSLTDGNLSRHLTVLSEAGLIETWRGANGPRPQTMYRLTADGRQRFADYISVLEKVVADAHLETRPTANQPRLSGGWSPA
ncbi:MAG: transcriptional regulator [Pirellulaceae bacterium]